MFFLQYTISPDDQNRRIDRVLRKFLKDDLTLSQIYKSLRNGQIKVNNKKIKQDYKTKKDDIIFIDEYLIKNIIHKKDKKQKKRFYTCSICRYFSKFYSSLHFIGVTQNISYDSF